MKTFAAIDVGSYELGMKIFEISSKNGLREIDHIRHRIDLGTDTFATGKMSYDRVDELSRVLRDYNDIMKSYKVDDYTAYGTSAIRETENTMIVLDQIAQRTGIRIEVLSNSEQRFLNYKAIASRGRFNKIVEKGTAIVDIGGGSIQISLFDKDTLVTTQNMRLGVLRLQDRLGRLNISPRQYEVILDEMVSSQIQLFKKLYLKEGQIENIIVVDDYISAIVGKNVLGLEESACRGKVSRTDTLQIKPAGGKSTGHAGRKHSPSLYFGHSDQPDCQDDGRQYDLGAGRDALRRHGIRVR